MDNRNEIRNNDMTQVVGGRIPGGGKTLNVLAASRWLQKAENFGQLSLEDQASLMEHATDELWLETFLHNGVIAGKNIIYQAYLAGLE